MKFHDQHDSRLAKIVEKQMRNWELARSQSHSSPPPPEAAVKDFICLSREVGAGASAIAAELAKKLGWSVFDREILHAMAGDNDIRERIYASMDERDISWYEELVRSMAQPDFIRNDYARKLHETLLLLARKGNGIFVGRGADLILPRNAGFRVRIIAPHDMRIRRLSERLDIPERDASVEADRLEEDRAHFILSHFDADIHDAQRYDLVINLRSFTTCQAAETIIAARNILKDPV